MRWRSSGATTRCSWCASCATAARASPTSRPAPARRATCSPAACASSRSAGIVERRLYSERPPRHEYLLTEAGGELHPVLLQLKEWGDRHVNPGSEPVIFEHTCGEDFHALTVCEACREPIGDGALTVTGGTHPVEATL